MPNYSSMGELIATQRKKKNLTQAQIATRLGVTNNAVSKWERNLSYPDTTTLIKLADIFDVPLSDLIRLKIGDTKVYGDTGLEFSLFEIIVGAIIIICGCCTGLLCAYNIMPIHVALAMIGIACVCIGILLIKRGIKPKK